MEDNTLAKSSFSATINAPIEEIEKVDIPSWCFTPPESEYQSCSPVHCSNYIEEIGQPDHLRLASNSGVLRPRAAQR